MPVVAADALRTFASAIIAAAGTPPDLAAIVGESLVDANLAGHDSHGVLRLGVYLQYARNGGVNPAAVPVIAGRDAATLRIDGGYGWGQPAMRLAADETIAVARECGTAVCVVERVFHIGRVAPTVETIARAGMIGIAMCNAGPAVAPLGGRARVLGTNPFAWAIPRGPGREPISFDIATSAMAEGKLLVAKSKGLDVPPGVVVDVDGQSSTNPEAFYEGGALLPFGGHKGYGLNVFVQMLGRALCGMDRVGFDGPRGANGPVIIAIDIGRFGPLGLFTGEVEAQAAAIVESPLMDGYSEVLLPGDLELRARAHRAAAGIPIPDRVWADLTTLATECAVSLPETRAAAPA